ncbi:unnamed protein product [Caenorhabditis angaria]|uniref:Uncharacterized protein n=1 Tax=Caenorhabditis angaria TaxID=860376 RepID=A0A9P1MXL8_9PELO|nr:unnamed protein product [Caenorhabditis angaria]
MTGRGQSLRSGSSLRQTNLLMNTVYPMESPRRARGRPRKYPLTSQLQLPNEQLEGGEQHYVEEEGEEVYYEEEEAGELQEEQIHGEEQIIEEEMIVEMEEPQMEMELETGQEIEGEEHQDEQQHQKIREIQQQKMMIVTPLGGKRGAARGRPTTKKGSKEEQEEMTVAGSEFGVGQEIEIQQEEEGTSTDQKQQQQEFERQYSKRQRNPPKRFVDESEIRGAANIIEKQNSLMAGGVQQNVQKQQQNPAEETIEPLLPNEAHIEEEVEVTTSESVQNEEKPTSTAAISQPEQKYDQPPPQPLLKIRGRPTHSSLVPPHRRPLPKDLVPPGIPVQHVQKRAATVNVVRDVKKLKIEKPQADQPQQEQQQVQQESAPSSSSSAEVPSQPSQPETSTEQPTQEDVPIPPTTSDTAPTQVFEENLPSTSASSSQPPQPQKTLSIPTLEQKKKREAGQDLPFEHMPRQRARHVSKAGILPSSSYDQGKYEMPGDVIVEHTHHVINHQQNPENLLHLEDGEYIQEEEMEHHQETVELLENEQKSPTMMNQPRYIEVEENGVKVVYEVQGEEVDERENIVGDGEGDDIVTTEFVIEDEDEGRIIQQEVGNDIVEEGQIIEGNAEGEEEDDDDMPPQLVPEEVQDDEVVAEAQKMHDIKRIEEEDEEVREVVENEEGQQVEEDDLLNYNMEPGHTFRLNSPGGRSHEVTLARDQDGNNVFIDENGVVVELVTDQGTLVEPTGVIEGELQQQIHEQEQRQVAETVERVAGGNVGGGTAGGAQNEQHPDMDDLRNVEFNFLDTRNICCGLCGEIVLYETLVSDHLPNAHPEFLQPGVELEEVPYENWLKSRLRQESQSMKNGFRSYDEATAGVAGFGGAVRLFSRGMRHLRKVSQIRVNPMEMTMEQLDTALNRKMIEKMGRKVPVTLIDRLHARCDVCSAVISLNKKFEIVHLVRHFNAWHPSEHRCSNQWKIQQPDMIPPQQKMLSLHDFAVVDTESEQNNLQCIWCGMFMDRGAVGMHFSEVHGDQVEVPKCSLCLQEMVMCARLMEKYGEDFGITLPDEFHVQSSRLDSKYNSEKQLDKAIERYLKRVRTGQDVQDDEEDGETGKDIICTTNSQQSFGRRNRMKRKFVKPCFRQICPTNSQYFEAYSACEWKCRLCDREVYGAVISAGAIKHYKEFHPAELENMQYELVKARLERIGDGSMEFVHPQLVECLICNLTYALHKPFNICRAIRHLRLKHPEVMPETSGKPISGADVPESTEQEPTRQRTSKNLKNTRIVLGDVITEPLKLERFRKEHEGTQFDKVQIIYGVKPNNEPSYILLAEHEIMDQKTAEAVAESMIETEKAANESRLRERKPIDMYLDDNNSQAQNENDFEQNAENVEEEGEEVVYEEYPPQIVDGNGEMVEMVEESKNVLQYIQGYDGQGQSGIIELEDGNVMVQTDEHGNYHEIIDSSNGNVQEFVQEVVEEGDERVQYMTEEELRDAEARGDIQIEYVDAQGALLQFEDVDDFHHQ